MTPRQRNGRRLCRWATLGALLWPLAPAVAGDLFSVAGITVDATAENAELAQQQAIALGQRRALEAMFRKLTLDVDEARLPEATPELLTRLARGYEVVNERRSGQRYIAELAVRFDPEGVREALRQAGIPYAETVSPPLVVLPVAVDAAGARLWAEPNPWLAAWRNLDWRDRLVALVVPFGELADVAAITAEQALAGERAPLAAIAARYQAVASLVAAAQSLPEGGVTVAVGRYGSGEPEILMREHFAPAAAATGEQLYRPMAEAVAMTLERAWKRENLLDFRVKESLPVSARLSGLDDWVKLRRSLDALSQIERLEVESLGTREARLTLHFFGPRDRLAEALAARQVALSEDATGRWRLELTAAGRAAAAGPAAVLAPAPDMPVPAAEPAAPAPAPRPPTESLLVE